ncbi:MAG: arginine--tRNA ligase [Lachnospiraceae bacterium]|nr:arginine--tRNA ligase [Lachnospiraceae bacterium]
MKKIIDLITETMEAAFEKAGYESKYARVTLSNRPDLCEYQCNGAMALAKAAKKPPMEIAEQIADILKSSQDESISSKGPVFSDISAVRPGFINLKLSGTFLKDYLDEMNRSENFGLETMEKPKRILVDYGGPNVAKPLHVGHLRAAIIGESIKRLAKYMGNEVIGDIHMGDWGLQMGLIITELKHREPSLPYFDESFDGEYPKEAPFTISELEEIYPCASAKSKEDETFREEALKATFELQNGNRGYRAIWDHIMRISREDLKKNYDNLDVHFEWWKGESDVQKYIPDMVQKMKDDGYAYESEGAIVVDVKEDSDTKEIPPCMILKSDGASLYTTTDLATLKERRESFDPDQVIYVVDKRQEMHFVQVFRCARKTGIVDKDIKLDFLGFGTMNGKDGKPFKTREGGVMRLENLISDINDEMYKKIMENHEEDPETAVATAKTVGLAALKYGDLSNQATKDYIFDIDKFTSFEGNTGPYILYTMVRIKSILSRYIADEGIKEDEKAVLSGYGLNVCDNDAEKKLMLELSKYSAVIEASFEELAPHKICGYIYDTADAFNHFYHENKILSEEDKEKRSGWIALIRLTLRILEQCIELLGFSAPERM